MGIRNWQPKIYFCGLLAVGCTKPNRAPHRTEPPESRAKAKATKEDPALRLALAVEEQILPVVQLRGEEHYFSLKERMAELRIPALSVVVFENYEIVWAKAYGVVESGKPERANEQTLFQAASISKAVNALTVLRVAAEQGLDLDAPVNHYLKSWKIPKHRWSETHPVTLRQLLSHTAGTTVHGFMGYHSASPIPTTAQILAGEAPSRSPAVIVDKQPGQSFRYSGGGTVISQLLVEDRLKQPYSQIASKYALEPLGMTRSDYAQPLAPELLAQAAVGHASDGTAIPGKRNVYPSKAAAGLWTTPSDLARFLIAVAKARNGLESPIPRSVATQMTSPVFQLGAQGRSIGLGPFLGTQNRHPIFGHGGANEGFRCEAIASLSDGFGYVIMTNSDNGDILAQEIGRTLHSQPGWAGGFDSFSRAPLPQETARALVGLYVVDPLRMFSIEMKGDRLQIRRPFEPPAELVHLGEGRFVDRGDRSMLTREKGNGALLFKAPSGEPRQLSALARSDRSALWELANGQEERALAAWTAWSKRATADQKADYEAGLNRLGYRLAGRGELLRATAVLTFATKAYPNSSNAFDSLAEIYALRGDIEEAIENYENALRTLRVDSTLDQAARKGVEARIRAQIELLRGAKGS